jgi:uncharacterized protein
MAGVPALSETGEEKQQQLREATSYRYAVDIGHKGRVWLEPAELFQPDDESHRTGRLGTGESVGWLSVELRHEPQGAPTAIATLEIRTRKLEYEREYRQMLKDIGGLAAEATVLGFAPTAHRYEIDASREATLLYQRFAVLCSRLFDEELEHAFAYVLAQPHREWRDEFEERPPGLPVVGSSGLVRALTAPGPRVSVQTRQGLTRLRSLPRRLPHRRTEETYDTVPNRFVRFALERWQSIALDLQRALTPASPLESGPARRGRQLTERVNSRLDELLTAPLLQDASPLTSFPGEPGVVEARGLSTDL